MTAEYGTPVDIANRALQHVGVGAKNRITSFTDDSKNAAAVAFAYDKVRRAELRRNVWRFAIRRATLRPLDTTTMLFAPPLWSATVGYQVGAIVKDSDGIYWVNEVPFNINHTPGTDDYWDVYFGALTIGAYDSTIAYNDGELVYEDNGAGQIVVYSALEMAAGTDPSATSVYSSTTTYNKGQVVIDAVGFYYISLVDQNLGNTPGTYDMWDANCSYALNTVVGATDGKLYRSLTNSNQGNKPQTDSLLYNPNTTNFGGAHWMATGALLPWTPNFSAGIAGQQWVTQEGAAPSLLNIIYPLNSGPVSSTITRNAYRLPNGYLREAPQDPKAGAIPFLGGPSGNMYKDWEYEGNYLVTREAQAIVYRFVADVTLVHKMDDMFCEGLACRLAISICEEITQAEDKLTKIEGSYGKFMEEARTVNGIEIGPVEAADDEFVSVRY